MTKVDKEAKIKKTNAQKIRASIERKNIIQIEDVKESSSSYSMSMYNLDSDNEDLEVPSHRSPTLTLQNVPLPKNLEEVHSSLVTKKILFERHLVIHEE